MWTQQINTIGGPYCHPILPDGCSDIVWIGDLEPMIAGPTTHRILATLPAGTSIIGARLKPGWVASFLGLPADELLNQHIPLTDISHSAKRLSQIICSYQSKTSKLNAIASAMISFLNEVSHIDPVLQACITWLARHPAGRLSNLYSMIGLSNRQIRRKFRIAVGYSPKTFHRIARFQRFLMLSEHLNPTGQTLASLAYYAGYSDQAHMCREVKTLAPQILLENNSVSTLAMSDSFNTKG